MDVSLGPDFPGASEHLGGLGAAKLLEFISAINSRSIGSRLFRTSRTLSIRSARRAAFVGAGARRLKNLQTQLLQIPRLLLLCRRGGHSWDEGF